MSKATGPLSPVPSPLEAVRDELAAAIEGSAPVGAFAAGCQRLEALAAEHPEIAPGIVADLRNMRAELAALAATGAGGRIAERLRRLESEIHSGLDRPRFKLTPENQPSAFGPPPAPRPLGGRSMGVTYPYLEILGRA
jgi:hypothetical protein